MPRVSPPPRWLLPVVAASVAAPVLLLVVAAAALAAEAPTEQAAAEDPAVVLVRSFSYRPDPVQVTAGSQVQWHWQGDGRHSVTAADRSFDSDPDCENNVLLRENCRTGGSEDFVWTAPDVAERTEIAYACKLHGESDGMTGTVVVVPAAAPSPAPEPSDSPEPAPSPSASRSEGTDGSGGGSGDPEDDPPSGRQTGTAPRLGTQTAPGSSPPSVASPEVAAPIADPDLEPFPSPAPIPSASPGDLGEVALDLPDDGGGPLRTALLTVATVAVAGTAAAFGSLVLYGPRWR